MRSRAQPASSCERTANAKTSSTNTAVYGNEFGPFGGDMRSRAQPASSCERTANAKTSSTNTAVYGNEFGPVGGDMRSRAQPASSCERTANAKTSSTNTAVYGNEFGPVGGDMRSRAQPASSCERTANAKTSSTNTAVYGNEFGPVGGDMRSRAQPASSCERTANAKTSSTNTAVYGNEFGPVGGDMRSRAQPASSCERTANSIRKVILAQHQYSIPYRSSTNTAVYGNEMGPVGGDMRSRVYPTSCVERTARDLSEVNTAKTSKSNQEIDKLLNSIISEVTALNEGDIQCNDEMRTAADRDNSLSQVHPSLLTQTPLSDCKAASAVPSIGNFNQ